MTEKEAQKLVTVLVTAFPNTMSKLPEDQQRQTQSTYRRMLADLDYPTANAAVERLLATSRFMPSIAEIREACMDLMHGDRKAGGEAWGACISAIGRFGIYRTPGKDFVFKDPLVARCVAALGWENLCNSENQAADRARFIDLYDRLAVTARRDENVNALPAAQRLKALKEPDSAQAAQAIVLQLASAKAVKS